MATPSLSDISSAPTYARSFGDGTAYALDFNVGGQNYTFVPSNVVKNGGVSNDANTYFLPWFINADNQKSFGKNASSLDLSGNSGLSDYLKSQGHSTNGYLVPSDQVSFDSSVNTIPTATLGGGLSGLKQNGDQIVAGLGGGHGGAYYDPTASQVHDPYTEYHSMLGDMFGGVGEQLADFANSDLGKAAMIVGGAYAGGAFDPSLGGAGLPAGITAEQLAAEEAAAKATMEGVAPSLASTLPAGITAEQLAAEEAAAKATMEGITAEQVGTGAAAAGAGSGLLDLAAANPLLTAGGVAALAGGVGSKPETPAAPASTPQTYNLKPYEFQRTYNPAEALTKDYSQGQNTGERNWMTDRFTALPEQTVPAKAKGGSISSHEAYMHPQNTAQHLAAQGRHGDDMLVHMNRNEVAGLQSLAHAHGKSLHTNPHTGMPEAFDLGQELGNATQGVGAPILGAGISYLSGGAIDPIAAAAMVGGTQAVVSGNLGKGLMAGLGAYGGASLVGGLSSMGSGQIAKTAGAGLSGDAASDAVAGKLAETTPYEKLSTGASYAANNPQAALAQLGNGSLWKGAGILGAAASPILADQMVKTTTGAPSISSPSLIRPYTINRQVNAPTNMVQTTYQPGQSTAERNWFNDTWKAQTPYAAPGPEYTKMMAAGGMAGGGLGALGGYSDGGRLLKGPGDGVSDSIPATIGQGQQPARLADGEFVVPARIVSELGNGSTDAGAKQLYKMMDRVQAGRRKTTGKNQVAANTRAASKLPA